MFYQKAAVMDTLVLKPCSQCLIETFVSINHLGLYAPLRIHPSAMRAKPCATWLFVGKILELPEPKYLCIKKIGKLKQIVKTLCATNKILLQKTIVNAMIN